MKNHREILGICVNILVAILLLLFIVLGLNKIGVYNLPDWVEKIVGTYDEPDNNPHKNTSDLYRSIEYDEGSTVVARSEQLSHENAKKLLENVSPDISYKHEISAEYFSGGESIGVENISVQYKDGLYSASVSDSNGNMKKYVAEGAESTVVSVADKDGNMTEMIYPHDGFDITDECGFIITADNFLSSDYVLDEASFYLENGTYGAAMTITFETELDGYSQTEIYTVSLDYGIVVAVECYEKDSLVYTMTTKSLNFLK